MKRAAAFLIAILILGSVASAQSKETRDVKGFRKVNFGIAGDLKIKLGNEFSVVLEGKKDDISEVITEVSGDKLVIKQENWHFNFNEKVTVYITMPAISGLSVSGSGRAELLDAVKDADEFSLNVSGSGKITAGKIETDSFSSEISGSGNIYINEAGQADKGNISISGSGSYHGDQMEADNLTVHISGSGNCTCKAGDSLKASISGSGNVNYYGSPRIDARVSGSGHVRSAS
jgi:hypothetical protein